MDLTFEHENTLEDQDRFQWKKGVRVLGISESFKKNQLESIVAGVVMRGDFRVDGFGICRPSVGGRDSTDSLVGLFNRLAREDIRAWMLGGSVISWFNIIDIMELYEVTSIPVVCVTYNPSDGIEKYLKEYFPDDWRYRLDLVEKAGRRHKIDLDTGHQAFLTVAGITKRSAIKLVNLFTIDGRIPEPIRVSRIIAAGLFRVLFDVNDGI